MSPGRAWSALTIWRSFCFASALRTQVWTAAQPPPGILWPACSSDHVTKDAHHGLPGPTWAAARYLSTSAPVLTPVSWTPSWVWAICSADAPSVLEPEPGAAAAAASTMPGTPADDATAAGGPAGAWAAMNRPEPPFFAPAASATAAMNWPDWPGPGGARGRGGDRRARNRGRGSGGRDGGRRGRGGGRLAEQAVGLAEAQPVAAAVLLGGALDVGDPVAELVRVGDGLAAGDPLLLDRLGLVEEPLDLQLGLVGEAGVGALVPDPDAHLEEADGVGVAEVEVLHAGLDQRGHDRQLLGQAALLRLAAHPRGDLGLRGVVAGVGVGAAGRVHGRRGGVGHAAGQPPAPGRARRPRAAPPGSPLAARRRPRG